MKYVTAVNKLRKLADRVVDNPGGMWASWLTVLADLPGGGQVAVRDTPGAAAFLYRRADGVFEAARTLNRAVGEAARGHREFRSGRLALHVSVNVNPHCTRWEVEVSGTWGRPGGPFGTGGGYDRFRTARTPDSTLLALARGFLAGAVPVGLLDHLSDLDETWGPACLAYSAGPDLCGPDELWAELEELRRRAAANTQAYGRPLDQGLTTHGLRVRLSGTVVDVHPPADIPGVLFASAVGVSDRADADRVWAAILHVRDEVASARAEILALRAAACDRADRLVAAVRAELPGAAVAGPNREPAAPPLRPVGHCTVLIDGHTVRVFGDPAEHTVVDPGPDPGPADPSRRMWMGTDEEAVAVLVERCYPAKAGEVYFPKPATSPRSWAVFYRTAGGGDWATNSVRFADREAARAAGAAKFMSWTACKAWRVEPSDDEPTEPARAAA